MKEKIFSRELRKALYQWLPSQIFAYKTVGSIFQDPGIPDLLCCIKGRFVGIENKQIEHLPKRTSINLSTLPEPNQILKLNAIDKAQGVSLLGIYIQDLRKAVLIRWDYIRDHGLVLSPGNANFTNDVPHLWLTKILNYQELIEINKLKIYI